MSEIKKKNKKFPTLSVGLFIVVLLISIGLYIGNKYLKTQISEVNSNIENIQRGINELKKSEKLQVYLLLEQNKNILKEMEKRSQITKYIEHLEQIGRKYSIAFSGFNISNGKVNTNAIARNKTDKILAYMNVEKFIKQYREDKKALFNLEFINSFDGMDAMKFNTTFLIK